MIEPFRSWFKPPINYSFLKCSIELKPKHEVVQRIREAIRMIDFQWFDAISNIGIELPRQEKKISNEKQLKIEKLLIAITVHSVHDN